MNYDLSENRKMVNDFYDQTNKYHLNTERNNERENIDFNSQTFKIGSINEDNIHDLNFNLESEMKVFEEVKENKVTIEIENQDRNLQQDIIKDRMNTKINEPRKLGTTYIIMFNFSPN